MCDFLRQDGLSMDMLARLSFKSELGLSLKKSIGHFPKQDILLEVERASDWYDEQELLSDLSLDYRVKSLQSAAYKYDRYYPNRPAAKVFDDLLGFRSLCDSYDPVLSATAVPRLRIVDMSSGKAKDDGYRGVHVYFQMGNFYYPIEIQYNTYFDRQLNNWLHKYIYKKSYPLELGQKLRLLYEQGSIRNEEEFKEAMSSVLRSCEEC